MAHQSLLLELLILFGLSTLVTMVTHTLRLPTIVGFIIAGMIVGPSGFALVTSLPNAGSLTDVMSLLLMFTIGLEFSFKQLRKLRREFLQLGFAQVMLTILCVAAAAFWGLGCPPGKAVFIGLLVSMSSTALVMKLLQDGRELDTPYGRNGLSILLFQDLAVIPMVLVLPLLAEARGGAVVELSWRAAASKAAEITAVLSLLVLSARYVIPLILERVVATRSREIFFFCILSFCLGVAYLFELGGMSLSLGAFAAGLIVSESPYARQVTSDIVPMRDNFLGLFFASIGMLLDLQFVWDHLYTVLGLTLGVFVIKAAVIFAVGLYNRLPASISGIMALILWEIGEFSFIIASAGLALGIISASENQYFLCVSVLSMAFAPLLYRLAPRLVMLQAFSSWKTLGASAEAGPVRATVIKQTRTDAAEGHAHTIIIGFGIGGQNIAAAMTSLGIPYRAIELNYEAVKRLKKRGNHVEYGDATRAEVLAHAGIATARLIVIAISGATILGHILAAVRRLRPDVQVIVRAQYVRDVEAIGREPRTEIVVAEIETSIELLARALKVYGVSSEDIRRYMGQGHAQLTTFAQLTSTLKSPSLSLPSWEALSSIKPFRIGDGFYAINRALTDLQLPRATGASIVSVFREGLGTTIPHGDFVLRAGDVTHLIGSPDSLGAAEALLTGGAGAPVA